jgi:hypothetical protein
MEAIPMKLVGIIGTAVLSLTLGAAAPAYAQQEEHGQQEQHAQEDRKAEQNKPAQQEEKHAQQEERKAQQEKPAQREEQHAKDAQPVRQDEHQAQQENQHAQQQRAEERPANERPQRTQQQQGVQESAWQEHRSQRWDSDHRTWQQRGGYKGYRIPEDRFRGYFGPEHGFRISGLPFLVVGGYPRFQYGGYWCSMVDPWPGSWAANWYDTDDVYVVYVDNGYYLFNRSYPNVGLAISISM